jgi:hypothetical protein
MTLPKHHNTMTIESKDTEMAEMPDNEFKTLLLKMTNDLKEDSNRQMK